MRSCLYVCLHLCAYAGLFTFRASCARRSHLAHFHQAGLAVWARREKRVRPKSDLHVRWRHYPRITGDCVLGPDVALRSSAGRERERAHHGKRLRAVEVVSCSRHLQQMRPIRVGERFGA
eukprot:scaffold41244_cov30-Tisochrysis_lutea.AAC.4